MGKAIHQFTPQEDAILREHYPHKGALAIQLEGLLRPIWNAESIRSRANHIGVRCERKILRKDGITTLDGLKARCSVTESGCWVYDGAWGGLSKARTNVWLPASIVGGRGKAMTPRRAALILSGRKLSSKQCAYRRMECCIEDDCCNPEHNASGTRSQVMRHAARSEAFRSSPARRAQYEILRRSRCIGIDKLRAVEQCQRDGLNQLQASVATGVSHSVCNRIYRGVHTMQTRPESSVFNLAKAAA